MAVCREMTKIHEEIVRGNPAFLLEHFEENNPRGEFVLVFSAVDESSIPADAEGAGEGLTIEERLAELLEQGYDKKAAIKTVARERGVPRREVYDAAIDLPASPMRKP